MLITLEPHGIIGSNIAYSYILTLYGITFCINVAKQSKNVKVRHKLIKIRHARIQKGIGGPTPPPLKIHKNIGVLNNTGLDPLKNHKATKPAFNFGPLSACQRNAISMAVRWRADDGPLIVTFAWIVFPL